MKKLFILLLSLLISIPSYANLQNAIDLYENGDYTNSFEEFKLLANNQDYVGQAFLSDHYFYGLGTEKNESLGNKWKEESFKGLQALTRPTPEQNYWLAYFLVDVDAEQSDKIFNKSFIGFSKLAASGDVYSKYMVALFYELGLGGRELNHKKKMKLYLFAAKKGYAPAQFRYGMNLIDYDLTFEMDLIDYDPSNVSENASESFEWLKKAAQQGNIMAEEEILIAAKEGYALAQFHYGMNLIDYDPSNVTENASESFEWLKKAAQQGNIMAEEAILDWKTQDYKKCRKYESKTFCTNLTFY